LYTCLPSIAISPASTVAASSAVAATITTAPAITATITTSTTGTPPAGFALILLTRLFRSPAFEHCLARKPDLPLRIDVGHHDGDLIAHINNVFHSIHSLTV
jgi:hypothetical protein